MSERTESKPRAIDHEAPHAGVGGEAADDDLADVAGGCGSPCESEVTADRDSGASRRRAGFEVHGFISTDDPTD